MARKKSREEYRRRSGSDTWHFNPRCRYWPRKGLFKKLTDGFKPTGGELCDFCLAFEGKQGG